MRCWPALWLGLIGLVGCRTPCVVPGPPPQSTAPQIPPESPKTPESLAPISPDLSQIPKLNLQTVPPPTPSTDPRQPVTEDECRLRAAANATVGNLIDQESSRSKLVWVRHRKDCPCSNCNSSGENKIAVLAALESRNRSAADALDRFYQLADTEGRMVMFQKGFESFERLRAEAPKFREAGLPAPSEEEILRQRGRFLSDMESARSGIELLNLDLKARLGFDLKTPLNLHPTGSFTVESTIPVEEVAVQKGLEQRSELQLWRELYHHMTPELLAQVRSQLQILSPTMGLPPAMNTPPRIGGQKPTASEALNKAEMPLRKQQLHDYIVEREKVVAAEIRSALSQLSSSARRVQLAQARAESWKARTESSQKPAEKWPAEIEWCAARAEVISAVMDWHRWRIRLLASQGLLYPDASK